jgi:hypothetical protein
MIKVYLGFPPVLDTRAQGLILGVSMLDDRSAFFTQTLPRKRIDHLYVIISKNDMFHLIFGCFHPDSVIYFEGCGVLEGRTFRRKL